MAVVTIVGAGMMGSALCWPLVDNGQRVRLVGTPLDEEIIASVRASGFHPTLKRIVPPSVESYFATELPQAVQGAELVIGGISSFGVDWFAQAALPYVRPDIPVLTVTKGLEDLPDGSLLPLPVAL